MFRATRRRCACDSLPCQWSASKWQAHSPPSGLVLSERRLKVRVRPSRFRLDAYTASCCAALTGKPLPVPLPPPPPAAPNAAHDWLRPRAVSALPLASTAVVPPGCNTTGVAAHQTPVERLLPGGVLLLLLGGGT